MLWMRATGSTIISQVLDSFVVSYLAFSLGKSLTGQTPASFSEILSIASTGSTILYFVKLFFVYHSLVVDIFIFTHTSYLFIFSSKFISFCVCILNFHSCAIILLFRLWIEVCFSRIDDSWFVFSEEPTFYQLRSTASTCRRE